MLRSIKWQFVAALFCFLCALPRLQAEEVLMAHRSQDFFLELSSDQGKVTLLLKVGPKHKLEGSLVEPAFAVENPWRIVIDANSLRSRKNLTLKVKQNPWVNAVRLGAHSDKLRIVVDLAANQEPKFTQSDGDRFTKLIFSSEAEITQQLAPTESPLNIEPTSQPSAANTPTASPSAQPSFTPSPTATDTPKPTASATEIPLPTPTPVRTSKATLPPTPTIGIVKGGLSIQGLEFEHLGAQNIPVLVISLTKQSQFKLEKQDERQFALTIPDSAPGASHLTLPQFPPHDFVGFTHIVCKQNVNDTTCQIGVERGVRITAFSRDKQVIVKALSR